MFTYSTRGTCSRQILFDVDADNKMHNVRFIGGCGGNLQGIAKLGEGKDIDEVQTLSLGSVAETTPPAPTSFPKRSQSIKQANKTDNQNILKPRGA